MGAPKPTLGYPSRTAAVLALREAGHSDKEIAGRIGLAVATIAALAYSGRRVKQRPKRPAEEHGRTVLFSADVLDRLREPAAARGITANELARRIVETVIEEKLVDAVLDDAAETQS